MLLARPGYTQVLQDVFNVDMRHIFTSAAPIQDWLTEGQMEPLRLSSVSRPQFSSATLYDDVYRETGEQFNNRVGRFEHVSYFESPLGSGGGGLGLELRHVAANVYLNPHPGEEICLRSRIQRFTAGIGRQLWGGRLIPGGGLGVNHVAGEWLPAASLALAARPHLAVSITARAGRRPGLRVVDWKMEEEQYQAEVKLWHSWRAAGLRFDFLPRLFIKVEYQHDWTHAPVKWYQKDGFGFNPEMSTEDVKVAVQFRPMKGSSFVLKWRKQSVDGNGEAFYGGEQMGKLTGLIQAETDVELSGTYRLAARSLLALFYGNYHVTGSQRGHLDPWPFSNAIFGQIQRIYYRGSGVARVKRLAAGYTGGTGAGRDWSFHVGYVWITPDFELLQRRTILIIFDSGEIVQSNLNLTRAELLVPEVRKTFTLGEIILTYAFTQAIPVRVRFREAPAPVEPPEEGKEARGGSFHMLKISYVW